MFLRHLFSFLWAALAVLMAACGWSSEEAERLMTQAENTLEQQPDSAWHYLRAIEKPTRLRRAQRMNFFLLWVQAKDKTGDDISADTLIGEVKNYFLKKEAWEKAARAAFYCGRVYTEQNDAPRALRAYMDADSIAQRTADTKRQGLIHFNIGWIYYEAGSHYDEATARFKRAAACFREGNYPNYCIEALKMVGTCFLLTERPDSAYCYQQQAITIAADRNDTIALAALLNNLSLTYRKRGDCQQAKNYGRQAISLCGGDDKALVSYLLNMAYVYHGCAQYDLAKRYATRVLQRTEDDSTSATPVSLYRLLAEIEKQRKNDKEAMEWQERYTDGIFALRKKEQEQSVAGVREKYELEVVSNKNRQLEIEYLRNWRGILLVVMGLVGIIFFLTIRYFRQKRKQQQTDEWHKYKKQQTDEQLEQLLEQKQQLLFQQVNRFKKAGLLKQELSKLKKENSIEKIHRAICRIFFDNKEGLTWDDLYVALNEYHSGVFERIKQQVSQLEGLDFKIACLVYAEFKNDEIADCLQLSANTVKMKKVEIRKKLGLPQRGKIRDFLLREMKKMKI
jgi:tetratricopeptide (TPR) repeat protein/DNA-binding CsgD family transcriptional regulator